jgi:hypothetical protein
MSRSRPNRSRKLEDEADVVYNIDTPFQSSDAKILLIDRGEDGVEVIIGNIPTPTKYDLDRNYPGNLDDDDKMRTHAVAKWIVTETTSKLADYDWKTSSYKTNKPNYHLRDVYFTCERSEVDDAVLAAKKFLTELEEKSVRHAEEFDSVRYSPSADLAE